MEDTITIELLLSLLRVRAAQDNRQDDVSDLDLLYRELVNRGVIERETVSEMERP